MSRIKPEVLIEHLEEVLTMLGQAHQLSKNHELTTLVQRAAERLERIIGTITSELLHGKPEAPVE